MPPYEYSKLNVESQEIRLLNLLPGEVYDDIRFTLYHAPLAMPDEPLLQRISLEDLQQTLPPGWTAMRTLEGRFIFEREGSNSEDISWVHPDPNFDHTCYNASIEDLYPGSQLRYEALSYTWGSTENPDKAYVENSGHSATSIGTLPTTLQIGQNLASAIRHLRYPDKSRTLWIDAVCINQKDDAERSEQVGRMASIYKLARRVVVWLGSEASDSNLALSTLGFLGAQVEYTQDAQIIGSPQCTKRDWFHSWTQLPYDDETWRALLNITERPWFERLWIWQEIQLANHRAIIQCGYHEISWYHFRRAVICLGVKNYLPSSQWRDRIIFITALTYSRLGEPLHALLNVICERKCSEPRDRVYGLLGLTSPTFASKIRPQYSLPVEEVYKDAFLVYINQACCLDLLSHCNLAERQIEVPSWVPDWSVPKESRTFAECGYVASGVSRSQARYLPPDTLEVIGVQCGTVRGINQSVPKDICKALNIIRKWEPEGLGTNSYLTGESLLDAYASTLRLNQLRERFPGFSQYPTLQEWKDIVRNKFSVAAGEVDEHLINSRKFYRFFDRIVGRMLLTMDEGYIGLGPAAARPGDLVCVFLGCTVPMLLRSVSSGKFQVVGSSYIHGLMDSEGLLGPLTKPWKVKVNFDSAGYYLQRFLNSSSGILTQEDPRLGQLPPEWERVQAERTPDDPIAFARFRNKVTEEIMNSDPRLLPPALKARDVNLQTFQLI